MRRTIAGTLLGLALGPGIVPAADLFDGFGPGWRQHWHEERFFTKPTVYAVVIDENGRPALRATSNAAHAGLVRRLELPRPSYARLRWRWKVKAPLADGPAERSRKGDDYAARVFVIFETSLVPLRTRAINYVWAAREPAGSLYPSPYSAKVGMFVLRSGPSGAGAWQNEERDLLADYRAFFGEPATRISGVAVLVDTDNTGSSAEAWFADLNLESAGRPAP